MLQRALCALLPRLRDGDDGGRKVRRTWDGDPAEKSTTSAEDFPTNLELQSSTASIGTFCRSIIAQCMVARYFTQGTLSGHEWYAQLISVDVIAHDVA